MSGIVWIQVKLNFTCNYNDEERKGVAHTCQFSLQQMLTMGTSLQQNTTQPHPLCIKTLSTLIIKAKRTNSAPGCVYACRNIFMYASLLNAAHVIAVVWSYRAMILMNLQKQNTQIETFEKFKYKIKLKNIL